MNANMTSTTDNGDDDYIDLRALILKFWARKGLIIASTLLVVAAFTAAALLMTPKYRATTVMVAASPDGASGGGLGSALGQLGGLASLAGINVGSGAAEIEEFLAVLRSREFTEGFIRDNELMPALFDSKWDPATKNWKGAASEAPSLAEGWRLFDKKVRTIAHDKKTGLVTVSILWSDPEAAAGWANELISKLNAETRKRAIARTTASVGFLQKELAGTVEIDTRAAINRLMEAQINQRMLASVTQEYAFRVVDRALPPDRDDVVSPNKPLLVVFGLLLGGLIGIGAALLMDALRPPTRRHAPLL